MQRWDDETVDLIYLDPPFNSNATYNVLYAADSAGGPQTRAFTDTWTWDAAAGARVAAYEAATARPAHKAIVGLAGILGPSGMLAYVSYMAERLEHMHRLLKPTGSLYYHCDPTASHYLKVVADCIFGEAGFINEVSWRRTTTKGDYRQGAMNWPRVRDVILHYGKGNRRPFQQPFAPYSKQYLDRFYRHVEPETGRRYRLSDLSAPGAGTRGHPRYEFLGVTRYWRYNETKMRALHAAGRIMQSAPGRVPAYKRYLDEMAGCSHRG